jgi:hypothetical protein
MKVDRAMCLLTVNPGSGSAKSAIGQDGATA